MGVASPLQSSKPIEYWLGSLTASELVHLWDFLSRNLGKDVDGKIFARDLPTPKEVMKHLYSESLPSSFLCRKTEGDPRSTGERTKSPQ